MSLEHEPFLPAEKCPESSTSSDDAKPSRRSLFKWKTWMVFGLAQLVLGTIYTLTASLVIGAHSRRPLSFGLALLDLKIESTSVTFHNLSRSRFAGEPSPIVDASWDELLAPMNIRVTKAELDRENVESVALREGGGYLSWIGAFHQLHCINMLRRWIDQGCSANDSTPAATTHLRSHVDHCIDFLRQSTLCRPDTSLTTFKWDPEKTRPMFNASESRHTCINWDALMDSMAARQVPEDEILRLRNPLISRVR